MRRPKKKRINSSGIMAIFIVVIMTSSIIGMMWNSPNDISKYKDHTFTKQNEYFTLKLDGEQLKFYYFPSDIQDINFSYEAEFLLENSQMIYFTFDPESKNIAYLDKARFDLTSELQKTDIYLQSGKTKNTSNYNLPIITCDNATEFVPVVYFKDNNITKFTLENNCIIGESDSREGFLALKDRLLYALFDII